MGLIYLFVLVPLIMAGGLLLAISEPIGTWIPD